MSETITIASRFCGPPESGNGGYSAGSIARELHGVVEVTLRKPPPLERALVLERGAEALRLLDGVDVVAEARTAELALDVPGPPSFEEASELSRRYVGFSEHSFPGCFVCGPARAPEDGLRIFPGRRGGSDLAAAPWVPSRSVAVEGRVPIEILWAALDCPGYFGAIPDSVPKALLGRITADISGGVEVGEPCVVIGWRLGLEGRKLHAGSALFGADGTLRGRARQTWIILNP